MSTGRNNCQLLLPVPTSMACWSIKLLVSAALVIPGRVGWSGTSARNSSKCFLKVSTHHIRDIRGHQVEQSTAFDAKGAFPGPSNSCRSCPDIWPCNSHPSPAAIVTVSKFKGVSLDMTLSNLPQKDYHVSLSTPLLRVGMQQV